MWKQLPNLLTLSRIVIIPFLVISFYCEDNVWRWFGCALFTLACVTDFFDGYLARRKQLQSNFGKFLDPIADKLLIVTVLFMLVAKGYVDGIHTIAALIILCREILVSGLREFLSGAQQDLPVTQLAKWKTTIQMVSLGILILGPAIFDWINIIGIILLWAATYLTVFTGYSYLKAGMAKMNDVK